MNPISKLVYETTYFLPNETYEMWLDRQTISRIGSDTDPFPNTQESKEKLSRIRTYLKNKWVHTATPIAANLGSNRGMPISCFVREIADSRESIFDTYLEGMWLGSEGTGIGTDWSQVREVGAVIDNGVKGTSSGVIPFLKLSDSASLAISQGSTRRSSEAVYLDISHPEIEEFINARKADRDTNRYLCNLHHCVIIGDDFMEAVKARTKWNLVSPQTRKVVKTVDAFDLFVSILDVRTRFAGEPYIMFRDNVRRNRGKVYRHNDYEINLSNLCTEILLHTTEDKANVCCLSSINLEKFDEYKDNFSLVVKDMLWYLDNILDCFLIRCQNLPHYRRVVKGVLEDRPLGLGVMGYHSYLQSKGLPFVSVGAKAFNKKVFSEMYDASLAYESDNELTPCLSSERVGLDERNAVHFAIAPTMNISILCDVTSQGIEPLLTNIYSKKVKQSTFMIKNKYLDELLKSKYKLKGEELDKVWDKIGANNGSVQHLDFLDEEDKQVYLTAFEINQTELLRLAAERQKYIDQAQSINLFFDGNASPKDIYETVLAAWEFGINTLYYQRSLAASRVIKDNERKIIQTDNTTNNTDCYYCQ